MSYTAVATSKTPALVIYLLDVSASMREDCGGRPRIDVVTDALQTVAVKMVQRSTKGTLVAPRYRVAMFAYSSQVIDLLGGIKTIDEVAKTGVPKLQTLDLTDTAAAFEEVERLLKSEIPRLPEGSPAPLVCHMTDGEFNRADPIPVAKRIMNMEVPDGNILIENIFIADGGIQVPDVNNWPGVMSASELTHPYAKTLFESSSEIPSNYLAIMREYGYKLSSGSRMFFPGNEQEIVEIGFVMSGATPIKQQDPS